MDEAENPIDLPARIYVDDTIMLATSVHHMKMVLVAMIEAIFVRLPITYVRKYVQKSHRR